MSKIYRQGDVLVAEVAKLPAGCCVEATAGDVILARGEATGHAHRVQAPGAQLYRRDDGATFLVLAAPGQVVHDEHGAIDLAPGAYQVIRQREYSPEEIRLVAD